MPYLRQSTSQVIRFGPALDIADGVTEETALTLAQADMRLSKDGGAYAQKNAAGSATHDSDGWYSTTLDATDTDTVGELIMNVHQPANMLPIWLRWFVLEEVVYDLFYVAGATGLITADVQQWKGSVVATPAVSGVPLIDVLFWLGTAPATLINARVSAEVASRYKKNTATSDIMFLMRDNADKVTPKTGLTVAGTRRIDDIAFASVAGTIAEIANGLYQFDASAADMNGDNIVFRFTATGAEDTFVAIRTSA